MDSILWVKFIFAYFIYRCDIPLFGSARLHGFIFLHCDGACQICLLLPRLALLLSLGSRHLATEMILASFLEVVYDNGHHSRDSILGVVYNKELNDRE